MEIGWYEYVGKEVFVTNDNGFYKSGKLYYLTKVTNEGCVVLGDRFPWVYRAFITHFKFVGSFGEYTRLIYERTLETS